MSGWNLPDDVSENDPRAPWNARGHCPVCCPAHEDSPRYDDPQCTECGEPISEGVCWLWAFFPNWLAVRLAVRFRFLDGLLPSFCSPEKEPPCECGDCDCGEEEDPDQS